MKKKTIKLTEQELHNLVMESIRNMVNEGTNDNNILNAWFEAEELMGANEMLDALYHFLDGDTIANFVHELKQTYEIPLSLGDEDEEYEDEEDIELY